MTAKSERHLDLTPSSRTMLAVVSPKNNDDEQALGDQFFTALGLPLLGQWSAALQIALQTEDELTANVFRASLARWATIGCV